MSYRVLLVEDEKAARDFFLAALERETEDFTALPPAENGRAGWEAVQALEPDVLVTDIRMPLMDGLELVRRVSKAYPRILTLVLSGYQEFDYARQAFTCGVEDYLLKPLNVPQFREIMGRVKEKLDESKERESLLLIRNLIEGKGESPEMPALSGRRVRLGIIREGGLVSRFSGFSGRGADSGKEGVWILSGRDRREHFHIVRADRMTGEEFSAFLSGQPALTGSYRTICHLPEKFPLPDLPSYLKRALDLLDRSIVLGKDGFLKREEDIPGRGRISWGKEIRDNLEYMLHNGDYGDIRRFLMDRGKLWERESYPLMLLESSLKEFLLILNGNRKLDPRELSEGEILLELYLSESRNYGELFERFWALTESLLGLGESELNRENIPEIFRGLCIYLENHYNENIRLNEISEYFNLSPSYINRLFNRYFSCSFTDYTRKCRIGGARKLLEINPSMAVQDVARYCGFEDPFYFSKVFKQETGMSPSQYKREE